MNLHKRHGQGVLFTTEGTKIFGKWFEDELVDEDTLLAEESAKQG